MRAALFSYQLQTVLDAWLVVVGLLAKKAGGRLMLRLLKKVSLRRKP